ncbi:bifunctional UDP-N-acetylglucosamine diphosphorylase/glucosamine-1-phosphate N-acetyltransferase GlmU [Rickettsiales bacterium]|nr:bifunctional UDP-N-acetylglucosamine diphosphorylase/glucosamine-1-phosphate N-acetyltransferase GlmU [Rickettsiales bacterium]
MNQTISIIILGAGKGTRMKSKISKVLHKIANLSMIEHVILGSKKLNPDEINIVISKEMGEKVKNDLKRKYNNLHFTIQEDRLGTGHAVKMAMANSKTKSDIYLILYGDTPFIAEKTLINIIENSKQNDVSILAFEAENPASYGRLVTKGVALEKIVEFKDATSEEKQINLCNSGVVAINGAKINNLLDRIDNKNASSEFYLTDIVAIAKDDNLKCSFIKCAEDEVLGVNSKIQLAQAEKIFQNKKRYKMMEEGVTLIDPDSVHFSYDTKIANDVIIHPNVVFGPNVIIESDCEVKSFSHIEGAKIAKNAIIGPFARIRPGTNLDENVKIGNFVEIKKSNIAQGVKINHLSYIGDANIDQNSNIGAGTITCNYDGYNKFTTNIGKDVFIGSNSSLIAPINIANNAMVGAGSVITKDVKDGDLAVCRSKQVAIDQGSVKFRKEVSHRSTPKLPL